MTALAATAPEPAGDIAAQLRALCDWGHAKQAVWVSAAQAAPSVPAWLARLELEAGTLLAIPRAVAELRADPSEETLAGILGYTEAKPAVVAADLPVVQALDGDGWVVWEMVSSWSRVGAARRAASRYGRRVRIVSMAACLERRRRLIADEMEEVCGAGGCGGWSRSGERNVAV